MTFLSGNAHSPSLDGDLRFHLASIKGQPRLARELQSRLQAIEGVLLVSANPKSGNVLILYEPGRITRDQLTGRLGSVGSLRGIPVGSRLSNPSDGRGPVLALMAGNN